MDWSDQSIGRAKAYGWVTSTPPAGKKDKLELLVKIYDGTGVRDMTINSGMALADLLNEAISLTRGRCIFDQIGYTACWSTKTGARMEPEYLDTQEQLDALFERIRKHQEAEGKKKRGRKDPGIVIRNIGNQVCSFSSVGAQS